MKYRITCLTPTLVGDGQKLSPIDYMVWKDHVNVLDQRRIFRLLAKGPRLEGYLAQLKKADKLDFASWGGFAQNFAGRRIPFEHASSTPFWERAHAENLFIPTFAAGPHGPYLPGTAVKGALRTSLVCAQARTEVLREASGRLAPDGRGLRSVSIAVEDAALGGGASNIMRLIGFSDSQTVPDNSFKVYLLRVSTLESRPAGKYEVAWKQATRGASKRAEDSAPIFAEMAVPGTTFEGECEENKFLASPDIAKVLRRKERPGVAALFETANSYMEGLLRLQQQYADSAGLAALRRELDRLEAELRNARAAGPACLLALGWGAGLPSKTAFLDTREESYRQILRQLPYYARAIQSNLPFPKTRKVVFLTGQPSTLPGFVRLEILNET
jgi:CRISPR-associated protein Csm5